LPTSRYSQDWKKKSTVDWSKYDPHYADKEREKEDQAAGAWEVQAPRELEIDKPNPTPDIDPSLSDAGRSMFGKTLDLLSPTKFTTPAPVPMTDQGKTELGNTLNLMDPNKWSMASGLSSLAQNPIQGPPSLDPVQGPPSPTHSFWDGFEDTFGQAGKTISNAAGNLWDETKKVGDYAGQFADQAENGFDSFTQQAKDAQKNSFMTRGLNALGDSLGSVADVADNAAKGTFQQAKDATKDSVFTRGFSQPNMPNRNLFDETMASQRAGTADVLETAGSTAEWAGENLANAADTIGLKTFANDLRTGSVNTGTKFRNDADVQKKGFEIQPDHEFTWSDLLDPHAYARWSRSVPLTASLMSTGFAGNGIAGTLGFVKNASPFVRELLAAGGAGAFSGAVQSAVQAGNIYEEARTANNMDPQTALHAANIDFMKNLPLLMGTNALEFATAFMPKGVSKALDTPLGQVGRFIGSGLQEGGEEAAQEVIDRQALGKEVKWDSNMQEQFAVGALMGMGMGTAGVIMHNMDSIVNRVKGKMNDETRAEFNDLLDEAKSAGIPEEEATKQALDALAEHPDAKPLFQEAVQEVMQSQQTEAQAKAPVDISNDALKLMEETKAQEAAQQANAKPEDTLVGYDPQNTGEVAFRSPDYDQEMAVVEQYNRLKEQMGDRAPKIPGGLTHTPDGDVSGRFGPVSQAPEWLQEFRKQNNRLPNQQELGELARKHVTEGYRDGGTRVPSLQEQQIQDELDHVTQLYEQAPEHEREGLMETAQHLMDALAEIQTKGTAPAAQEPAQPMTPRQEEYEKVRKAFPEANLAPYQEASIKSNRRNGVHMTEAEQNQSLQARLLKT
jgi:hypothetical protein